MNSCVKAALSLVAEAAAVILFILVIDYSSTPMGTLAAPASKSTAVPLGAQSWTFEYSNSMPTYPAPLSGGIGWYFNFPVMVGSVSACGVSMTCPSVNYLTTHYTSPIVGSSLTMVLQVVPTGPVIFNYQTNPNNTCVFPAHVRAFIERSKDQGGEYYRWWSNPISFPLGGGSVTVTTPLTPDQWSDVLGQYGSAAPTQFYAALQNVGHIGMTFGGGCFFGHGVNVGGGTAQFILTNYTINP